MPDPLMRKNAQELAQMAYDMGLAEEKIYHLKGGPLAKQILVRNIRAKQVRQAASDADIALTLGPCGK